MSKKDLTLAHVTHEAVEQLGGIGTVLEGLMISPVYQSRVKRSILIGPTATHMASDPASRLGDHGKVLYSSVDDIDDVGLGAKFRPVEWAFNVKLIYGTRTYNPPGENRSGKAEVLLIDVFRANPDRLNIFKLKLWERFGLDSSRYESAWDYEEYTRLAEPAFYALRALLSDDDLPCVLFAHEFMGMPSALQAILDGGDDFRTVFHAHECATARRLVETHPGHDTMFYNIMNKARKQGLYVDDVFGDQSQYLRHALISRTYLCDGIIAVGDHTKDELHFLNDKLSKHQIDLVYNGLPAMKVTLEDKNKSRTLLQAYAEKLVGHHPDILMTHITRPVVSKGMWRDLAVCSHLDTLLAKQNKTGVLFILTSAGGVRRKADIRHMEEEYDWPRQHRNGFPDLVGPEIDLYRMIEPFNQKHDNIQIILVNQFGWSQDRIGKRLPKDMNIADLRRATDVEFGLATYEPFGISPLEPLGSGAICCISSICGCDGFVKHATQNRTVPNVITADYTRLDHDFTINQLKDMTIHDRDLVEQTISAEVAETIAANLPANDKQRAALIDSGQKLVSQMGWDQVLSESLLPLLDRVTNGDS
ncbi:hypothetical protein [Poriferisphaera sp. WC338]|uniref:hypothetical protein n=1 Tax=Poriferisphaera sp. WC338 TaxID=3425129 RepID=UPI003D81348F